MPVCTDNLQLMKIRYKNPTYQLAQQRVTQTSTEPRPREIMQLHQQRWLPIKQQLPIDKFDLRSYRYHQFTKSARKEVYWTY